ncbi:Nn.00g021260.m01.CDS01 [Neocucurbitaria sp. VM-36]
MSSPDDSPLTDPESSGVDVLETMSTKPIPPPTAPKAPPKTATKKRASTSNAMKSDTVTTKQAPAPPKLKVRTATERGTIRASTSEGRKKQLRQIERDPRDDGFGGNEPRGNGVKSVSRDGEPSVGKKGPDKEKNKVAGKASTQKDKGATASRKEAEKRQTSKAPEKSIELVGYSSSEEELQPKKVSKVSKLAEKPAKEDPADISSTKGSVAVRGLENHSKASQPLNRTSAQLRPARVTRSSSVATGSKGNSDSVVSNTRDGGSLVEDSPIRLEEGERRRSKVPPGQAYSAEEEARFLDIGIEKTSGFLDAEADQMFDHIVKLASNPREWLDFLNQDDYAIATGKVLVTDFGHTSAYDTLVYLFAKMNDNAVKKYEQTCFDYKDIKVRIGEEAERYCPNKIWKAYADLVNGTRELHKEKAIWHNNLWKKIVSRNPYLLRKSDDRPHHARTLSYVLLLVLTLASKQALGRHIQGDSVLLGNHNIWYEDCVSNLLKHLRRDIYPHLSTWQVTQMFHHLATKIQGEQDKYEIAPESDSDSELETAVAKTAATSVTVGQTGKGKDAAREDGSPSPRKRKSPRTHSARGDSATQARINHEGQRRGGCREEADESD